MITKEEMSKLLGKEILLRSTAFGKEEYFYYAGIPALTVSDEVYFKELYHLFNSHSFEFTKKTGVIVQPKHPGFFKLPYKIEDGRCYHGNFLRLSEIDVLEVNE